MEIRSTTYWTVVLLLYISRTGLAESTSMRGPEFLSEPSHKVEFSNNTGTKIPCKASGQPPPMISWIFIDGTNVVNVLGLREIHTDGTLVFSPFKAEDYRQDVHAVAYRCMASNSVGIIISREVHVRAVMSQHYDLQVYDAFAIKGNTAVLKCHIPGFLGNHIVVNSWIKDNAFRIEALSHDNGKYMVFPSGELYISDVGDEDAGSSYRCQATHRLTGEIRISTTAGRLFVTDPQGNVPPRVLDGASTLMVKGGESVTLPCVAQGYPNPTATWFYKINGKLQTLINGERVNITKLSLTMKKLKKADSGTYVCSMKNIVGNDRREINMTVAATLDVKITPEESTLSRGGWQELRCSVSGFPKANIMWFRNGREITTDGEKEILRVNERGMYQCFAQNDYDIAQAASQVNAGDKIPELISTFPNQTVNPGKLVELTCVAFGIPLPSVLWYLDDVALSNKLKMIDEKKDNDEDKIQSKLHIPNIKTEEGGVYKCVASNPLGNVEYSMRINVYGKLGIRKMQKLTTIAGEEKYVHCPYYGFPVESIQWKKDKKPIPLDPRIYIYDNGTLKITRLQKNIDSGKYTCVVKTDKTVVSEDIDIVVMISPKIMPFSFQEDLLREGMRARLQCVVSEGDTPIIIKWKKDGQNISDELGIVIRQLDEFSSILTINTVTPRHNGNYTCEARNEAAVTRYSANLYVNGN